MVDAASMPTNTFINYVLPLLDTAHPTTVECYLQGQSLLDAATMTTNSLLSQCSDII